MLRLKSAGNQPRDDHGRFATTGSHHGGSMSPEWSAAASVESHAFLKRGTSDIDAALNESVSKLTGRIRKNPEMRAAFGEEGKDDAASGERIASEVKRMRNQWVTTSGDHSAVSLSLQRAAIDEFGLDQEAHGSYGAHIHSAEANAEYEKNGKRYRAFLRASYEETQDTFKAAGITHVALVRGLGFPKGTEPDWSKPGKRTMPPQAISSWSTSMDVALNFSGNWAKKDVGRIAHATVPIQSVVGTGHSTMGALGQYEVAVLHSPGNAMITNTKTAMAENEDIWGITHPKKSFQHGALERKALEVANDSIIDDLEAQFIVDLLTAFDVLAENAAALLPGTFAALGAGALSTLGATALSQSTPHFQVAFTSAQTEASRQAMNIVQAASGAKPSDLTKPMVQAQVEYDHRTRLQALLPELGRQTTDAIAAAVKKSIESGWGPYEAKKEVRRLVAGANMYPGVAEEKDDEAAVRYRSTVIARTEVAWARNTATTRYFDAAPDVAGLYVVDGPECGWAHHDDEQKANGIHVTFEMARNYPIAHPNCRRSFGPVFAEGKWLQYFLELKYNPNQARGADGRWSGGFHHGPTRADLIQGPLQSELAPAPKPKKPPKPQGAPNAGTGVGTHHPDRHNATPQGSGPKGETKPAGGNVDQKAEQYVTKGHEYWLDGTIDPEMEHVWNKMTHDTAEAVLGDPELKKRANAVGLKSRPQVTMMAHNMSNQWVSSATDSEPKSIALHLAAHEEFGLDPEGHKEFLSRTDPKALAEAKKHYAANGEKERVLLRGMYNATQKDLAAQGITEVTLHRGLLAERKSNMKDGVQHVHHNALNSYTSSDWIANGYADGTLGTTYLTEAYASGKLQGKVISATIPASHIFSTGHTGFGSVADREYIVLGAKGGKVNVKAYGE